jgi:hypothetical protein
MALKRRFWAEGQKWGDVWLQKRQWVLSTMWNQRLIGGNNKKNVTVVWSCIISFSLLLLLGVLFLLFRSSLRVWKTLPGGQTDLGQTAHVRVDGMMTEQLTLRIVTGTTGLKKQTEGHAFLSRISRK